MLFMWLPFGAQARTINVPLDGTPVSGICVNDYDPNPNNDSFGFTLDSLSRVRIERTGGNPEWDTVLRKHAGANSRSMTFINADMVREFTLRAGTYSVYWQADWYVETPVTVRITVEKLDFPLAPETGDEHGPYNPMELDTIYEGYIALFDTVWYSFTLDRDSRVEANLVFPDQALTYRYRDSYNAGITFQTGGTPQNRLDTANLMAGSYRIAIGWADSQEETGRYTIRVRESGKFTVKAYLMVTESSSSPLAGSSWRIGIITDPPRYEWDNPVWSVSNKKVASVEIYSSPDSCNVHALRKGSTVVRVNLGDRVLSKKLTVTTNNYSVSKPSYGKERTLYTSHKRIYYNDGYLWCEAYLTNRTKKTILSIDGLVGVIYDKDNGSRHAEIELGVWRPKTPLRPNKSAVIKFRFPQQEYPGLRLNYKRSNPYVSLVAFSGDVAFKSAGNGVIPRRIQPIIIN